VTAPTAAGQRQSSRKWGPPTLVLALVAYVPYLLSSPGRVAADTKQYLYLDPGRLMSSAASLWDPGYGAGTVTHQNVGYLFPMGPYYWLTEQLGVPDWLAQRFFGASISFAAGAGVLFLLATLGWRHRWSAAAGALVFMLTPYQLAYSGRISAILLPWAGLPWMIALTIRAVRRGGWRDPAWFALVTVAVGGTNATSLLYAGLAPALWLAFAVLSGEASSRRTLYAAGRIVLLVLVTSTWWISGLVLQGSYGINYLDVSESVRTVAQGSSPTEVLRGLGNWFFYGGDAIGPWIDAAIDLTTRPWLLAVSFAVPLLAIVATVTTRWRYRIYFVALLLVGIVAAVGAYPYGAPTPLGGVFKEWATGSSAGLAMRSTPRAVPLVALALAVLLAAGLEAVARSRRGARTGAVAAALVGVVVLVTFAPVWRDGYVADRNSREEVPAYWHEAAAALDRDGSGTRVLEIPGAPDAAYRWGTTVDPVTPGLIDRPWISRELIPYYGSPATASLLVALDHRIQEGTFEPDSLVPVARLLRSGTVLVRSDLEYERSDTPRPRVLWSLLTKPRPAGLERPTELGSRRPNVATHFPVLDEVELRTPPDARWPPAVALFPVSETPPIAGTAPVRTPVLVAGDGEALVDAAAAGLIDGTELVLSAASYANEPDDLRRVLADGADVVVSDTNRRRARRWGSIRDVTGATERAGQQPRREDSEDKRIEIFPGSDDRDRSVVEQRGVRAVDATSYGERSIYAPDQRAAAAFDGDASTAWRVGGDDDPTGQRLVVDLTRPVATDHVVLTQPRIDGTEASDRGTGTPARSEPTDAMDDERFITRARLHFGRGEPLTVDLDDRSRTSAGQRVTFPRRPVEHLEIEVLDTNLGELPSYGGVNGVGFSEVQVGPRGAAPRVEELVRLPTRIVRAPGMRSLDRRLVYLMSRLGYEPSSRRRQDEEPTLARRFEVPADRSFGVTGRARVAPNAPDATLDAVLGTTAAGAEFRASGHLRGDAGARASRAFDHDPATAWVAPMGAPVDQVGQWIEVDLEQPVTLDHLELQVVADGKHSVPTRLRLEVDGVPGPTIDVPAVPDAATEGATARVPVSIPAVTGREMRLVVDAVRPVTTPDPRTHELLTLPVAIAETGMPDVPAPSAPGRVPDGCRTDLLTVDGAPLGVRATGDVAAAEAHRGLTLEACDGAPVDLTAGSHVVRSAGGLRTGLDVDRLVLASDRGGGPLARSRPLGARREASDARLRVTDAGLTSVDARVTTNGRPFWLVLGQSHNDGWELEVDGSARVGPRTLVNGYANGWRVTPDGAGELTVRWRWTPQGMVWWGMGISVLGILVCLVLALTRRGDGRVGAPRDVDDLPSLESPVAARGGRPATSVVLIASLVSAFVVGVASRPWIGLVVGTATLAALLVPRARVVLTAGSVAAFALAAAYVVVQQARHGYPTIASWPSQFDAVADLVWLAVWLLGADVVVEQLRERVASRRGPRPEVVLPRRGDR
jgi:arabinofuranan 3-O-arabinosyltransferase